MTPHHQLTLHGIHIEVYADKIQLGVAAAAFVADTVNAAIQANDEARVIFATGASQYAFLDALVKNSRVDWSKVTAFHLDEYLNLPPDHPASFRKYLRERLFNHLTFKAVHLLDGDTSDAQAECARYAALLSEAPINLACIGIGENAHLAFNDPPADFETSALAHIVNLDEACRLQQVGEGHFPDLAAVPTQALSLSIPAILQAKTISCVVPDRRKAEAVHGALYGPLTPRCPASALRKHKATRLFLDVHSAAKLD